MNKQGLVEAISEKAKISKARAAAVIDAIAAIVQEELAGDGEVFFMGLGKFRTGIKAERMARNPHTGERMKIPARRCPKFTAAKALKEAVAREAE